MPYKYNSFSFTSVPLILLILPYKYNSFSFTSPRSPNSPRSLFHASLPQMAQAATTNFYLNHGATCFYVQFNSTTRSYPAQFQAIMSTRQAIFAFLVGVLLTLLQVKFNGNAESPFQTHPNTVFLAIASLLVYCLAYDAKLRISEQKQHPSSSSNIYIARNNFICCSMAIFGPLSLVSILSMLVPERLCPLLFSLAILFTLCQLPPNLIRTIWNWLKAFIQNKFCSQSQGRTAMGVFGFIAARLPLIPERPISDQIDILVLG